MRHLDKIRNIGIIAHVDAGKTTLTERILYFTGLTYKLGNVDDGNTVMDTDPQESKRGITIQSAAITTKWGYDNQNYDINIIDTPGHVDFIAEVERSLRVLDGAITVFCAKSGVEPQSEAVWRQSDKYKVPRLAYINKMDREGADFNQVVEEMKVKLNALPLVLQVPVGQGKEFRGVVDLLTEQFLVWDQSDSGKSWQSLPIPEEALASTSKAYDSLIEQLATVDDHILDMYLKELPISVEEVVNAVRKAVLEEGHVPVLCGAAYKNIGVQPLLDAIVRYLPSPKDRGKVGAVTEDGEPVEINTDITSPFAGLVFKVVTDKYVGKIAMVRGYSGVLKASDNVYSMRQQRKLRVSRILRVLSDKFEDLDQVYAGEIYALVGLKDVKTGDTICAMEQQVFLESIRFSEPVIGYAIEAKHGEAQHALGIALSDLQNEDPTLQVVRDPGTGQTILNGMGELHLEVVLTKLEQQYKVDVSKGAPKVSYQEMLTKPAIHREFFKKQSGGNGQYADITFEIGPRLDGRDGLDFVDEIKGGIIPKEFIPSVKKGFELSMQSGLLAGYPLKSMRIRLFDGKVHTTDSHALDFEIAAMEGFKSVYKSCKPALMEPIMIIDVQVPQEFVGGVTGDLNSRGGMISAIDSKGTTQFIRGEVPLRRLFGYIIDLRSLSAGRGTATIRFSHYAKVQQAVTGTILTSG